MRRGSWILAISGMMALHQSGYAADPAADQTSGRAAVGTAKITSKKPLKKTDAAADSKPKNYYKDLFGDEEEDRSKSSKRRSPATAPSKADSDDSFDEFQADSASGSKPVVKPSRAKFEFDDSSPNDLSFESDQTRAGTGEKTKITPKVSQAGYDRPIGKKDRVQQIRNDGRPKSAPPMIGFDEGPPKNVRTAAAIKERDFSSSDDPFSSDDPGSNSKQKSAKPADTIQKGPQTSQITLEWVKRGDFNVGQECHADLIVRNAGTADVSDVSIDGFFPTDVRLTAAEPNPAAATDRLTWTFDRLAAGSEQKITVKMVPSKRGDIGATAQVRFTGATSTAFGVQEPLLKIAIKSPTSEIMLGDPASQMITLTNPGTGTAHDVKIEAKLSEGLEHPTRENRLIIDVGSVGPGETRTYRLPLAAAKGGTQSVDVIATSSSEVTSADSVQFDVIAPSLKIAVEGPSLRYKGRNAKYTLTVTNDGNLVNNNIRISQAISEGFKYVNADHNGKFDPSINTVQWFVGRLEPGQSTQVTCDLNSLQIGEFTHKVQVVSDAGVQSDAKIDTRIDGIASLTMELVDLDDPVEVGSETSYEIHVKNDGSKIANGIVVACELPAGMKFISAKAPVEYDADGRQLVFAPIERLAPGDSATFRIHMNVVKEGSHRMRARLTGGGLQEPMGLEEVTRAYSDGPN